MTTYGTSASEKQGITRKESSGYDRMDENQNQEPSTLKKIIENRWLNLILFIVLFIIVALSIACVTVVSVLHYHLLFVCGYFEFILLVALEGCILAFCFYHMYHIFQLFKKRAQTNKGVFGWFSNSSNYHDIEHYDGQDDDDEYEDEEEEEEEEESRATKITVFVLKFAGLLLSIVCIIGLFVFTSVAVPMQQLTLPTTSGSITLSSFKVRGATPPTITRESNGVVHVEASDDYDAFFAQGFSIAQDRMWQLEFNKRVGSGSLAEIAGKDALQTDKASRTIGFRRAAASAINALSKDSQEVLQAYCDGINAYINSNPTLAPEFKLLKIKPTAWEPIDVVTWGKVMAWSLGANMEREVIRYKLLQRGITKDRINELLPQYPTTTTVLNAEELNITLTPQEIDQLEARFQDDSGYFQPPRNVSADENVRSTFFTPMESKVLRTAFENVFIHPLSAKASNNWVLAGHFTKSGLPFVANDPHLGFSAPGVWYLTHVKSSKSGLDVIGATFAGTPGVIIGRNKYISWGVTNGYADVQDLFALEPVAGKPDFYRHNGKDVQYQTVNEIINIKGGKPITLAVKLSVYGPVINEIHDIEGDVPLSLQWTALLEGDTTVESFIRINYAKNHDEFVAALQHYVAPVQNFIYADVHNNIAYYLPGAIPIRKFGHSGRYVVPGNGTFDYFDRVNDYIPFEKLPQTVNPSRGYVVSANNRVTAPGFEYSISQDFFAIHRARRIESMILNMTATSLLGWQDMRSIQYDVKSTLFEDFRFVFNAIAGNVTKEVEQWRVKLTKWDAIEKLYSQEASIFEAWYYELGSLTQPETGLNTFRDPVFLRNALLNNDPVCHKYTNKTCLILAAQRLEKAITSLEATYGSIPLWGSDIHQSIFPHQILDKTALGCLASKNVMNIGGQFTVNVADITDAALTSKSGVSYRQIISLANNYGTTASNKTEDTSDKFIIPLGQSGNFLSPLYDNLLNKWKDGQYLDMKLEKFERAKTVTLKGTGK
jgi:penicillin amidase